jgi:hypothetical protein
MRGDQNEALAQNLYYDASQMQQMQQAIVTVLDASAGTKPGRNDYACGDFD